MAKAFTCTKCGGSTKQILSATEFKCIYCDTLSYTENTNDKNVNNSSKTITVGPNPKRMAAIGVATFLLVAVGGFAFFATSKSAQDEGEQQKLNEKRAREINDSIIMVEHFKTMTGNPDSTIINISK